MIRVLLHVTDIVWKSSNGGLPTTFDFETSASRNLESSFHVLFANTQHENPREERSEDDVKYPLKDIASAFARC